MEKYGKADVFPGGYGRIGYSFFGKLTNCHSAATINAYTVLLIWIGRAPFDKHTNEKCLVDYLELIILPKVRCKRCEKGPE